MLKLMKYEMKKQAFTKIVCLVIIAVLQLVMGFFLIMDDMDKSIVVIAFVMMAMFIVAFYFSIESIATYSRDLKTKNSYMLFMVPRSTYTVIGAKLLTSLLTVFISAIIMFLILALDFSLVVARFDSIAQVKEIFLQIIRELAHIEISFTELFSALVVGLITWFSFITTAFLSITASKTVLADKKISGVVSVALFFGLNWIANWLISLVPMGKIADMLPFERFTGYILIATVLYGIWMVITYVGTVQLLDKKISL